MRILDTDAMREVDRTAIEEIGIPSLVLMENAAIGVVDALAESFPEAVSAAVFCGPGNNGGDGLAIARHLQIRGYHVEVSLMTAGKNLSGDAGVQLEICRKQEGLSIHEFDDEDEARAAIESAAGLDLAVDALFGTGLARPLTGYFAAVIEGFNRLRIPRIAVDLPSGLNGSSPEIMGPHAQVDLTVTFAAPKLPHCFLPAADAVGEVVVADLGIPGELVERAGGDLHLLTREGLADHLVTRAPESHKGDFGHVLVVAGSSGKAGAAILAARAAVRGGAGLVTVASPLSIAQTVDLGSVESMTLPLEEVADGGLDMKNLSRILDLADGKQGLAIGPGLGTQESTVTLIRALVEAAPVAVVLDADGLNAFAGRAELLAAASGAKILTPHPGEAARLLESSTAEVQADRIGAARALAAKAGAVVVLKGARSLIAAPEGEVFVNPTGNPGMASGGTGDVLTGLIISLVGQGYAPAVAACLGTFVHGVAGDVAAAELGETSLSAGDLLNRIPDAWRQMRT